MECTMFLDGIFLRGVEKGVGSTSLTPSFWWLYTPVWSTLAEESVSRAYRGGFSSKPVDLDLGRTVGRTPIGSVVEVPQPIERERA